MKMSKIDLGDNEIRFRNVAKHIFTKLKQSCPNLDIESKRAVTTMIAVFDVTRHPNSTQEDIEHRTTKYISNITRFLKFTQLPHDASSWILLLTVAAGGEIEQNTKITTGTKGKNHNDEELNEIVLDGSIKEIQRKITEESAPGIKGVINQTLGKICKSKSGKVDLNMVNFILKNKLTILNNISAAIKLNSKNTLITKFMKIFNSTKFRNRVYKTIINKALLPAKQKTYKNLDLKNLFPATFSIIKKVAIRQIFGEKTSKRVENAEIEKSKPQKISPLYNMLHCHNPIEHIKIPNAIANNLDIKREAKRLKGLGMSPTCATSKADIEVKEHRQQISCPTKITKEKVRLV